MSQPGTKCGHKGWRTKRLEQDQRQDTYSDGCHRITAETVGSFLGHITHLFDRQRMSSSVTAYSVSFQGRLRNVGLSPRPGVALGDRPSRLRRACCRSRSASAWRGHSGTPRLDEGFGADDFQQCEFLSVSRARGCGVEHEVLVPLGNGEGIAVDGDRPGRCVAEGLLQGRWCLDVVSLQSCANSALPERRSSMRSRTLGSDG